MDPVGQGIHVIILELTPCKMLYYMLYFCINHVYMLHSLIPMFAGYMMRERVISCNGCVVDVLRSYIS